MNMKAVPAYGLAQLRSRKGSVAFTPLVSGPGASAAIVHQPVSTIRAASLPDHVVCVSLSPVVPYDVVWEGRLRTGRFRRGDVAILPCGFDSDWEMHCPQDVLHIHVSPALLSAQTERIIDLIPTVGKRRASVERLAARILREPFASAGDLACALLLALECEEEQRHGLGPLRRRAIEDYTQATLAESISVATLAALCGLSPFHFTRAFAREYGSSPHQWLIEQRLNRAEALLGQTTESLANVALACGFVDQAHLTRIIRTRRGTTPARLRRATGR
jgi:AraC family transcriptional regulator